MTPNLCEALSICIQARRPVFLWGEPGTAKTAIVESIARSLEERLWTNILSIREPTDQGGLPLITPDGVVLAPPDWAVEICAEGKGILFWDEFNGAAPTTQNSCLRVIQSGIAGSRRLPAATSHVAAGNPADTSTGVFDLTSAMANRLVHLDWHHDIDRWTSGMLSGFVDMSVRRLPEKWEEFEAGKRGLIASFIRVQPSLLHVRPTEQSAQGHAWPSPRSWTNTATLLAAATSLGYSEKSEVTRLLIAGSVGEPAMVTFNEWFNNLNLPDPEEVLANPLHFQFPAREDQLMAILDSVAAAALRRGHPQRKDRFISAWRVVGRIAAKTPDITVPSARTLGKFLTEIIAPRELPSEVKDTLLRVLRDADVYLPTAA